MKQNAYLHGLFGALAFVVAASFGIGGWELQTTSSSPDSASASTRVFSTQSVRENSKTSSNVSLVGLCGDGIVDPPEECDDGNTNNGDGCENDCSTTIGLPGICGVVDGTHIYDADNNGDALDASSPGLCEQFGVANFAYDVLSHTRTRECWGSGGWTNPTCSATEHYCSDGILTLPETCDDGNTNNGDGCDSSCQIESGEQVCGDGTVNPGEECDDGNTNNDDTCNNQCENTFCGDGIVQAPNGIGLNEECDGSNLCLEGSCCIDENQDGICDSTAPTECEEDYSSLDYQDNGLGQDDITYLQNHILGIEMDDPQSCADQGGTFYENGNICCPPGKVCDLNCNGTVSVADVLLLSQILQGVATPEIPGDGIDNNCDQQLDCGSNPEGFCQLDTCACQTDYSDLFDYNQDGVFDMTDIVLSQEAVIWTTNGVTVVENPTDCNGEVYDSHTRTYPDGTTFTKRKCCPEGMICDVSCNGYLSAGDISALMGILAGTMGYELPIDGIDNNCNGELECDDTELIEQFPLCHQLYCE